MTQRERRPETTKLPGLPPGTVSLPPDADPPQIHAFGYGPEGSSELGVQQPTDLRSLRGRWPVLWVNFNGLGSGAALAELEEAFGIHHLVTEDIATPRQRPKVELYPDHVYVVLRMQRLVEGELETEQLNLILGDGFVVTVQEAIGDPFDPVRQRLRVGSTLLQNAGPDFLAYALIDAVVDHYFPLLREFGDQLDALDERILERPTQETLLQIKRTRRTLLSLRRSIWPMRDAIAALQGEHIPYIAPATRPYLRDVFDHSLRILDLCESYREQAAGLMDGYMSAVSFRMNEVMGILTVVGTIFLPLGFLTGLYGMNFDRDSPWNLPELSSPYGYPILLLVMTGMAAGMLWMFYRRGWFEFTTTSRSLGSKRGRDED